MEPQFTTRQFCLIGFESRIRFDEPFGDTIERLWRDLVEGLPTIPGLTDPPTYVGYWYTLQSDPSAVFFMAAAAVDHAEYVPIAMVGRILPSSRYAVFHERRRGEVGGPDGYAYKVWLPGSGFELNTEIAGDLEVYHGTVPGAEQECDIYIPLR